MEEDYQEERDIEEPVAQVNNSLTSVEWDKQQSVKLINIVAKTLDLDQYPIFLPNLKQPITFYEFEETYKKDINFGSSVLPTIDDDFIRVIDEIKMTLRTIVRERLLDAIRKQLEVVKNLELNNQELKSQNTKLRQEVSSMAQEIKDTEEVRKKNISLSEFVRSIVTDIDSEYKFFRENVERKINKRKEELGIKEKKEEEEVNTTTLKGFGGSK